MSMEKQIKEDALKAADGGSAAREGLAGSRIAITGGTGFLGTWIAETIAALNDDHRLGITLDIYSRNAAEWGKKRPHLSKRKDMHLHNQDVRSSFEFAPDTAFVIHAAGIPDNRVHASDPLRVFETTVIGTQNALEAATKLPGLKRFVNISSGLVSEATGAEAGKPHLVYIDAKRSSESLGAIYRSQHRLPVSTIRPFTFIGPYQELDRPWAVNNFIRDALTGHEIRLHGDGDIRRSYLYGADAAWWTLSVLARGADGKAYNIGSSEPVSHKALAERIAAKVSPAPSIVLRTAATPQQHHDFIPDVAKMKSELKLTESCTLDQALDKAIAWYRAA